MIPLSALNASITTISRIEFENKTLTRDNEKLAGKKAVNIFAPILSLCFKFIHYFESCFIFPTFARNNWSEACAIVHYQIKSWLAILVTDKNSYMILISPETYTRQRGDLDELRKEWVAEMDRCTTIEVC